MEKSFQLSFERRDLLTDGSKLAEVTTGGRLFHTRAAATPNARSPMVRIMSL